MKLRSFLWAVSAIAWPSAVFAQEGQPWVGNRTLGEGAGVRTGNVEFHPGIAGEFGYDSNFFQRAGSSPENTSLGPVVDALRLRVTPQLSLRSVDRRAEGPEEGRDDSPAPIAFEVDGSVSYNELIAVDSQYSDLLSDWRNLQGGGSGLLKLFPGRKWSGNVRGSYNYTFEPSNQGGLLGAFNRHTILGGGNVIWRPGGGAFDWTLLDYSTRFILFNESGTSVYDNRFHNFTTNGTWRFLPKTALLFDAELGILEYDNPNLNSGERLQARLGANGLLTKHLGLLVMGGWATSFFHNDNGLVRNFDDFIAKAEARWYFNAGTRLQEGSANVGISSVALGYDRTFQQSYLSDFFQKDRGYGQLAYFFGGRVITTLDGGVSRIHYPDFLFGGVENQSFGETRIDITGFAEYRVVETVGINLTLRYDQNISQVLTSTVLVDDLSFERFRGFLGVRWFM